MLELERLTDTAIEPVYGTTNAAAFDIHADIEGRTIRLRDEYNKEHPFKPQSGAVAIPPYWRALIPTGFIWHLGEGWQLNFMSRSGLTWKNGVIVLNAPAVIDEDYKLESFVVLYNSSNSAFKVGHGDRVAQGQINPVNRVELNCLGDRLAGFGSSGK